MLKGYYCDEEGAMFPNDSRQLPEFNEWVKYEEAEKRITELEALRDTVSISCNPPKDCNNPVVLKTYMKACFDEAEKLYD